MPELRCTVQTCLHNKDFYCDLDGIRVGGNQAKSSEETCCDSFEERKGDSYSNVTDCTYNDECSCHAGKISVEGSQACQCEQTECATFTCGCRK